VNSGKFSALNKETTPPPVDPSGQTTYAPLCPMPGSYVYSLMTYGADNLSQIAIIAARVEIRPSGNYGTGSDLTGVTNVQNIINAKKSTIPDTAPDQLFVVYKLQ